MAGLPPENFKTITIPDHQSEPLKICEQSHSPVHVLWGVRVPTQELYTVTFFLLACCFPFKNYAGLLLYFYSLCFWLVIKAELFKVDIKYFLLGLSILQ